MSSSPQKSAYTRSPAWADPAYVTAQDFENLRQLIECDIGAGSGQRG
jgi:hypothetical protein